MNREDIDILEVGNAYTALLQEESLSAIHCGVAF